MSLITKNNYEAYLLDYVEENLSPELVAELMLFLENNPTLKGELDGFELHELVPLKITLEDKEALIIENNFVTQNNCEDLIIAEIESENTTEISEELHSFLAHNPEEQADFIAYQNTKLAAPLVIFEDKKPLKRKEGIVIPLYWWYTSAAAVIIILFLFNMFTNTEQEKLPIADKKERVLPEVDNKADIRPNKIVVEGNNVAVVNEKNSIQHQAPIQIIKKSLNNIVPEEMKQEIVELAGNSDELIMPIIDSIVEEIIELPVEEIKYADNVKITYEDDPVAKASKSKNGFNSVGQFLTKPLKKKILTQDVDENGEVIAYAINVAGLSFSRNKRKRKN